MQTVQAAADRGRTGQGPLLSSFHLAYVVGGAVALLGVAAAAMTRSTVRVGIGGQAPEVELRVPVVEPAAGPAADPSVALSELSP
jgi:hypothetical protein